jgi:hypothetical protein
LRIGDTCLFNVKDAAMTTLEVEATVSSKVQITLPAALRAVLSAMSSASKKAQRHGLAITDAAVYSIARAVDATFWAQNVNAQGLSGVRFEAKPTRL